MAATARMHGIANALSYQPDGLKRWSLAYGLAYACMHELCMGSAMKAVLERQLIGQQLMFAISLSADCRSYGLNLQLWALGHTTEPMVARMEGQPLHCWIVKLIDCWVDRTALVPGFINSGQSLALSV